MIICYNNNEVDTDYRLKLIEKIKFVHYFISRYYFCLR